MQVFCSNCNTAHDVTYAQAERNDTSIINCKKCDKKIKFQFCPHCGAFYSVTFSNIKHGRYRYSCRKCGRDFAIMFSDSEQTTEKRDKPVHIDNNVSKIHEYENHERHDEKPQLFSGSINSFTTTELFKAVSEAFSLRKILIASIGVTMMLFIIQLSGAMGDHFFRRSGDPVSLFTGSLINLFPMAVLFSFYTLTASLISKITLDRIFHSTETESDDIFKFMLKSGPGVFAGNIILLLTVSSIIILFGKIPFVGPLLFSIAFLPVYIMSIMIFLLCFIGIWFYPPVAAHRESGIITGFKYLLLFIRKHNLNILFMVPVILLLSSISFSVIFFLHLSAFSFSIAVSKWLLDSNASEIFSSIPALFIKASESLFAGLNSGMFKELNTSLMMTHHAGGFIIGIVMFLITVLLISIAVSITATISTHIYIVMERGISIDDRKKAVVLFILSSMMILIITLRKII